MTMTYQFTIEPLGATIEVAEGQTLLDAALRQGIYIPHACGHGLCGTCKVQVLEGDVDHGPANPFALMDVERDEGKTLACCATALTNLVVEADVDEDPDAEIIPLKDFDATVARAEMLTPTIRGVWLKLAEPLHFQAGQYVQLHVPVVEGTRAFSIANSPDDVRASGLIELNIRRVPGGAATGWLHDQLAVGSRLRVSGPSGRFFVRSSQRKPIIFMAGGSGLSSPRSMILDLLAQGWDLPITLVYGQRTREELYYHEAFEALAQQHPNFHYVPCLSNEPPEGPWAGARGFVHEVAQQHFQSQFAGHQAYLCGPPPMIEACIGVLMRGRLFERDIYTERFVTAADAASAARSPLFHRI